VSEKLTFTPRTSSVKYVPCEEPSLAEEYRVVKATRSTTTDAFEQTVAEFHGTDIDS